MRPNDHIVLEIKYEEVVANRVFTPDMLDTVFDGTYSTKQFSWIGVCPSKEIGMAAWTTTHDQNKTKIIEVIESAPLDSIITSM